MTWIDDFWRRVRECDSRRDIAADGKTAPRAGERDSDVLPDPHALDPLPDDDDR